MTRESQDNNRSISTELKPATAVRLKSLPWNFGQLGSDATTATSHSRRTTDNLPVQKFQSNVSGYDVTKPSTGSTNLGGLPKVTTQDGIMNRSREDDIFESMK